jgi:hypothetical protein
MQDAKDLHADITGLLLDLHNLREFATDKQTDNIITVEVNGGTFS